MIDQWVFNVKRQIFQADSGREQGQQYIVI